MAQNVVPVVPGLEELVLPADQVGKVDIIRHPAEIYLLSLSHSSRMTMRGVLNSFACRCGCSTTLDADGLNVSYRFVAWHLLRYPHMVLFRHAIMSRYAPATANKQLGAVRQVVKQAWRLGLVKTEAYFQTVEVDPVRGFRLPPGRTISVPEMEALFAACDADQTPIGVRDAAVIAVLRGTGMRRAELVGLHVNDYSSVDDKLHIKAGKGSKERAVYLPVAARLALEAWLKVRGDANGPMFYAALRGGKFTSHSLTPQSVALILHGRRIQASVEKCTPHDVRRTYISELLDCGVDIVTVQRLAGHNDPGTTAQYDRRGERAKQRATALIAVPYSSKRNVEMQ